MIQPFANNTQKKKKIEKKNIVWCKIGLFQDEFWCCGEKEDFVCLMQMLCF